jgi:hypothetical protein
MPCPRGWQDGDREVKTGPVRTNTLVEERCAMGRANVGKLMDMLTTRRRFEGRAYSRAMASVALDMVRKDVSNDKEFMAACAEYCAEHFRLVSLAEPPISWAHATATRLLGACYPGGIGEARVAACTGTSCGLGGVLKLLGDALLHEVKERCFLKAIRECVEPTDANDVLALVSQYLDGYGHACFGQRVPPPSFLAPRFMEVIREHVAFIQRMRAKFVDMDGSGSIRTDTTAAERDTLHAAADTAPDAEGDDAE